MRAGAATTRWRTNRRGATKCCQVCVLDASEGRGVERSELGRTIQMELCVTSIQCVRVNDMAFRTSMTLRVARNIVDGNEYVGSIATVQKRMELDVPEDDKAYVLLQGSTIDTHHEIAVGLSSSLFGAAFNPICVVLVNDALMPFSPETLSHFVDRVLERLDFSTFKDDPLEECLGDFKTSRTVLLPSFQLLVGARVQFVLFIRG